MAAKRSLRRALRRPWQPGGAQPSRGSELDPGAAPAGSSGAHPPCGLLRSRDDREPEAGPPACASEPCRCGTAARTRARAPRAGIPGPSSMTANGAGGTGEGSASSRTRPVRGSGVLDRVAREVAQRLREAVGIGDQRAGRDRAELEVAVGGQLSPVPEVGQERRAGRSARASRSRAARPRCSNEQVVDQAASCA